MRQLPATTLIVLAIASAVLAQPGSPPSLAGNWVGVYQSYPYFMKMTLQMAPSAPDTKVATQLRIEPLVQINSIGRAPMGIVGVDVEYDAAARTIVITPGPDAYRVLGSQLPRFFGLLDEESGIVGGTLVGGSAAASPYFLLTRTETAENAFLKKLRNAIEDASGVPGRRPENPFANIANAFGRGPSLDRLREWVNRFAVEYPDVDPYHTEQGKLFSMARSLFRDQYFKPYFDKTFDEMGRGELMAVVQQIQKIPPPRSNFPEEKPHGALHGVSRAFSPTGGTYASLDVMFSVLAMRPMDAWRAQSLRRLQGEATGLRTVRTIEQAESEALATLWPSERKAFAEVVVTARSRVSAPALALKVDELVNGATSFDTAAKIASVLGEIRAYRPASPTPATPVGRRTLERPTAAPQALDSIAALMATVSPDLRQKETARLESAMTQLVEKEVARDAAELPRLGDGLAGLQAGAKFRSTLDAKYQPFSGNASVQKLFTGLAERRKAQLASAEPSLDARLKAAKSTTEVDQIVQTYLSVPSDRSDAAGGRLLQIASARGGQLRTSEQAMAVKEAEAQREANSACARTSDRNDADAAPGEPTERDMCKAVESVLLGKQRALEDLKDECKNFQSNQNPASAMLCLGGMAAGTGGGPQISLRGFKKIACSSAASAGRPGFFCDYVSSLSTGNQMMAPIFNHAGGEVVTARFVKTSGVWIFMR
jgi:hypothetical protein